MVCFEEAVQVFFVCFFTLLPVHGVFEDNVEPCFTTIIEGL